MNDRFLRISYITVLFFAVTCTVALAQPDTDYPGYDPSLNDYENLAATLLAEDVKHTYGGDNWVDSLWFAFDFVVYNKSNQEIARYHNEWNRLTDEGVLSGKLSDGRSYIVNFSNLSKREGTMMVDSQEVAAENLSSALSTAYTRLSNNIRWLVTPLRLLDSDVQVKVLSDSILDGKEVTPMKVAFNDSTSSTDVLIYINTGYKQIERWRVNYDGVYQEYIWRLTRRIGPFLFATRLWAHDFKTYVQLERIKVKQLGPDDVAQSSGKQ